MKKKRVEWCLEHRNFDWSNVIFSNKSSFQLYCITQKQWGKRIVSIAVPKHAPKIMIWGGISWCGKTVLAVVNNSIKAYDYQQIMDEYLVQIMDTFYPDGWLYQHDNAPPHTAKTTQKSFHDQNIT